MITLALVLKGTDAIHVGLSFFAIQNPTRPARISAENSGE